MPTVSNSTDGEICVRTGTDSYDFRFYFVPAHGSIEVSEEEAEAIAARVEETKTAGITVSGILEEPLSEKPKEEAVGEEASVEVSISE